MPKKENHFKFIDLFAGIGGFRIAFESLGGECVFSSEWDKYSQQTYAANFGEIPHGDITSKEVQDKIPKSFDLLCAGFPCQAFSIAGKRGGFNDTRGTLFFEVAQIIKKHRPKVIFLENVKGLVNHDRGKTLSTILNVLREDLGYFVPDPKIMNAKNFGVPQNRERIFILGFKDHKKGKQFKYPEPFSSKPRLKDIKEEEVESKYYLSQVYLDTLKRHKDRHASKGNGFGYEIIHDDGCANAIVVGGMGRERNLVIHKTKLKLKPTTNIKGPINNEFIRKMTPKEWAKLQGFPNKFNIVVSNGQAYKQFGNSVAIPAIKATGYQLLNAANIKIKETNWIPFKSAKNKLNGKPNL